MGIRAFLVVSGWLAAALCSWPGIPEAATYQLQVASVPERVFMHFVKGRTLPHAEGFFDDTRRSRFVLFRDRQPQTLTELGQFPVNIAPPNNPWGATTWNGDAGELAVFSIRGIQSDHQRLRRVAVQTNGVLTRFPVRGIPASQSQPMPVPATAANYLVHAVASGTFTAWVERRAVSYDGLSVIVGKHHDAHESDTVYLAIRMPQTGRTFKVVLGWKTVKRDGAYAITPGRRN